MSRASIEVINQEEVEEIAYRTAFLIKHGWARTDRYDSTDFKKLTDEYNTGLPSNVWFKKGHEHRIYPSSCRSYNYIEITVPFF